MCPSNLNFASWYCVETRQDTHPFTHSCADLTPSSISDRWKTLGKAAVVKAGRDTGALLESLSYTKCEIRRTVSEAVTYRERQLLQWPFHRRKAYTWLVTLTMILDRTVVTCVSCLSRRSSGLASSKCTLVALKRDFLGAAGVKGGISSEKSWSRKLNRSHSHTMCVVPTQTSRSLCAPLTFLNQILNADYSHWKCTLDGDHISRRCLILWLFVHSALFPPALIRSSDHMNPWLGTWI